MSGSPYPFGLSLSCYLLILRWHFFTVLSGVETEENVTNVFVAGTVEQVIRLADAPSADCNGCAPIAEKTCSIATPQPYTYATVKLSLVLDIFNPSKK